jgi:hypothetical protein
VKDLKSELILFCKYKCEHRNGTTSIDADITVELCVHGSVKYDEEITTTVYVDMCEYCQVKEFVYEISH